MDGKKDRSSRFTLPEGLVVEDGMDKGSHRGGTFHVVLRHQRVVKGSIWDTVCVSLVVE